MGRGFTLIELLVYTTIFAVVGVVLTSIFVVFLRVDIRETASAEISNQANFILQRIQNYINNASFLVVNNAGNDEVDDPLALPYSKLVIKDRAEGNAADDALSPIVIFKDGDLAKVQFGRGTLVTTENLNNDKVKITNLTFTKVSSPPGRDSVIINLSLEYNNPSLPQKISRSFALGVGKASAAVFDTNLNPGTGNTLDIGVGNRWRDLFLSGNLTADGAASVIKLGNGSNSFAYLRNGTIFVDPPLIAANSNYTVTITTTEDPDVSGFVAGDRIFLTPPSIMDDGLVLVGATTAANSLQIKIRNTGAAINDDGRNWYFWLVR